MLAHEGYSCLRLRNLKEFYLYTTILSKLYTYQTSTKPVESPERNKVFAKSLKN